MDREWFTRMLQVTVVALTLAVVFQELEKPKEEREWHGKVVNIFPYDFRIRHWLGYQLLRSTGEPEGH